MRKYEQNFRKLNFEIMSNSIQETEFEEPSHGIYAQNTIGLRISSGDDVAVETVAKDITRCEGGCSFRKATLTRTMRVLYDVTRWTV